MQTGASLIVKAVELNLPAVVADKISRQSTRWKTAKLSKELYSILDHCLMSPKSYTKHPANQKPTLIHCGFIKKLGSKAEK